MGKKIYGRVVDEQNAPVEFATVFVSDINGKPTSTAKNTTTNDKGTFSLDNLNDSDYVTIRYVGLTPKTLQVKNAINVPVPMIGNSLPTLLFKMTPDESVASLQEVVVTSKYTPKKESHLCRNCIIAGGFLLLLVGVTLVVINTPKFSKA